MTDNDDNIKKAMENFNESVLKNTAISFSLDAISRDLKFLLNKKIYHNTTVLKQISRMIDFITTSESDYIQSTMLAEDSILFNLFKHASAEIQSTNEIMDDLIEKAVNQEMNLRNQEEE